MLVLLAAWQSKAFIIREILAWRSLKPSHFGLYDVFLCIVDIHHRRFVFRKELFYAIKLLSAFIFNSRSSPRY